MIEQQEQTALHTVVKNSLEEIRFFCHEYKGKRLASIRVFYKDLETDAYCPSKKGLTFRVELLSEIRRGIDLLIAQSESEEVERDAALGID